MLAVTGCELMTPTEAFTVTLVGFTESCGAPVGGGVEETGAGALLTEPAQPELASDTARITTRNTHTAPRSLREECIFVDFSLEPEKLGVTNYDVSGSRLLRTTTLAGDLNQEAEMLVSGLWSGQLVRSTGFGKKKDSSGTADVEKKWKRVGKRQQK